MKKLKLFTAVFLSFLIFCSCGKNAENQKTGLSVVTTVFPLYDFTMQLCGEKADVTMLLPAGAEVHSYEPTVQDILRINKSDLFINIGGSADPWATAIMENKETENVQSLSVSEKLELIKEDHGHEHEEATFDEHVWTSPKNAMLIVSAIADELCRIAPENEKYFRENEEALLKKLSLLDQGFSNAVQNGKRKTIIFADSFPFRYLTRDYGLDYFAAFPGCSAESEPSVMAVTKLIEKIEAEKIPVVFYTETSNQKMADTVVEETGVKKLLMHSCHSVTKKELENKVTYADLMEKNLSVLTEALN